MWAGIGDDAEWRISHDGVLQCYEQGGELIGKGYSSQVVSVHDPDEYLAAAKTDDERKRRFDEVLGAYRALFELKSRGAVKAVGIRSIDWRVIRASALRWTRVSFAGGVVYNRIRQGSCELRDEVFRDEGTRHHGFTKCDDAEFHRRHAGVGVGPLSNKGNHHQLRELHQSR